MLRRRVRSRLGASPTHVLPAAAIEATLRSVERFLADVSRDRGPVRYLGVATAAVRDAQNRDDLLLPLAQLGVKEIRVLSGAEEGRIGAEVALRSKPIERGLVVDLGGGSLQVTTVLDGTLRPSASVPLGCVRLLRRFVEREPPQARELDALRFEVRQRLRPLMLPVPPNGDALISGGIVKVLAKLALSRQSSVSARPRKARGSKLNYDQVSALREWLEPMTLKQRKVALGRKSERADIVVIGAIVVEELITLSGYPELTVSRTSVREGILLGEAAKLGASA